MRQLRILTVSGSLRVVSSSGAVLDAIARLAPSDVIVERYSGMASLPHFNPDVEEVALPHEAAEWRARVAAADALLIASPEYAHGVPGSLKNALDWLVGGPEFVDKPVAVVNPSAHSKFAHVQLIETLRTMSGNVVMDASVTLRARPAAGNADAIVDDAELVALLRSALAALCDATQSGSPSSYIGRTSVSPSHSGQ
ncbi:MAG TPA: NADPH-dependent FMN reductase [Gemmatimonadaceae bacterium]|nr:NADPH-dependent FMN reductase [Gemmatimonadaceae bacterium]